MSFFPSQRLHTKGKRKTAHKKPKIRWHLLGLSDPSSCESVSHIDVIRQEVASLAKGYPLELHHQQSKPIIRQGAEDCRSKKKVLTYPANT
jgi:hypothetical protein